MPAPHAIALSTTLLQLGYCVDQEGRPYGFQDPLLPELMAAGLVEHFDRIPNGVRGDFYAPTAAGREAINQLREAARL